MTNSSCSPRIRTVKECLLLLNFSSNTDFSVPDDKASYTMFFGNYASPDGNSRTLQPWEGRLYYINDDYVKIYYAMFLQKFWIIFTKSLFTLLWL